MELVRMALGIRFLPEEAPETDFSRRVWETLGRLLAAEDTAGLSLHGGFQEQNPSGEPERYYLAVFSGGGLKQMRRIYRRLLNDAGIGAMLCPQRPYIENNILARMENMTPLGQVQEDGSLAGDGDHCLGMRFSGEPTPKRAKR